MIGILTFAFLTGLAYYASPSMPLYSAKDIQLISFHFSMTQFTISAKILAGVEIDNDNVIGGDLYSAHVDIYYPDWNGELQSIGYLQETKNDDAQLCQLDIGNDDDGNKGDGIPVQEEEDHGVCMTKEAKESPFFSVQSRGVSQSKSGAITIYLQNVSPEIYLNIIWHMMTQWGSIDLLVSGVAHVKTPLGVPLSLGVICDNFLDLTKQPTQIVGRDCIVERISTGWGGLEDLAAEVKDRVLDYYSKYDGDVFQKRVSVSAEEEVMDKGGETGNRGPADALARKSLDDVFASSEVILDWHDF